MKMLENAGKCWKMLEKIQIKIFNFVKLEKSKKSSFWICWKKVLEKSKKSRIWILKCWKMLEKSKKPLFWIFFAGKCWKKSSNGFFLIFPALFF
jgi:hypothetical protein